MTEHVDIILISRDRSPPSRAVADGIASQVGPGLCVHRVIGTPRADDPNRWATIARARNAGRRLGSAPWVLYLDDDVVLGPGCIATLRDGLRRRPAFAALAADYLGEVNRGWGAGEYAPHVGMGATLFRRDVLAGLVFRWEPGRCECQCCCDDLRRAGFGIGYLDGAAVSHERSAASRHAGAAGTDPPRPTQGSARPGRVMTAFNRHHAQRFRTQFMTTFRASGNAEPVTAVGYGLYPSESHALASLPGVEVVALPDSGEIPAVGRLRDFQGVISRWPEDTRVAYWDAGDVAFQGPVAPLWDLVGEYPDEVLAVYEPDSPETGRAIGYWTRTITDPDSRRRVFELLSTRRAFNGGFAAGTARTMLSYLRDTDKLRHSNTLKGTRGGDQIAMNYLCYTNPGRFRRVPDGWNYCLHKRTRDKDFRIDPRGRFDSLEGEPIHVVHGNARTLKHYELSFIQ